MQFEPNFPFFHLQGPQSSTTQRSPSLPTTSSVAITTNVGFYLSMCSYLIHNKCHWHSPFSYLQVPPPRLAATQPSPSGPTVASEWVVYRGTTHTHTHTTDVCIPGPSLPSTLGVANTSGVTTRLTDCIVKISMHYHTSQPPFLLNRPLSMFVF